MSVTSGEGAEQIVVIEEEPGDVARLTFFSDAAVAISLTLLVLPVADYVRERPATSWSTLLIENPEIIQAAVAFITVITCWRYHHVLYERMRDYSRITVWLNFFWLFCVVSIPVLTLAALPPDVAETEDYRNFFETLFVDGEAAISDQNYFVMYAVIALSFLSLALISMRASVAERGLAKPGLDLSSETWIYLRPALVCAIGAVAGLINPGVGDIMLILGIAVAVIVARRSSTRAGTAEV